MKEIKTMVSPPPGFSSRVMARVQRHKNSQARRRVVIAVGVLMMVAVGSVALAVFELESQFDELASFPSRVASFLLLAMSLAEIASTLSTAVWLSVTTVASSIYSLFFVAYVGVAVSLSVLWLRLAFGPFRYPLANRFTED